MADRLQEVEEIIARSGNSFHYRVMAEFKKRGWTVLVSPYYNDVISGKPREIDLIVEKAFPFNDGFGGFFGDLNLRLFIECKWIAQTTAFWFVEKDKTKALSMVLATTPFHEHNVNTRNHHYLSGDSLEVAKLFADAKAKAAENEVFFKALNQVLNGFIYYRHQPSIINVPPNRQGYTKFTLEFPVILCNCFDLLYRVNTDGDKHQKIQAPFQLEMDYAYSDPGHGAKNEYFLVDIVSLDSLDGFLEKLETDLQWTHFFLGHS